MEFFGVSPLELLIIAVLGLIIFGPERLPQIGRTLGRFVARILAWQYTSPEAQLLNELRRDFEKQIVEIRDEMVYARQQLDISSDLKDIQRETEALIRADPTATPTNGAVSTTDNSTSATPSSTSDQQAAASTSPETSTSSTSSTNDQVAASTSASSNGTASSVANSVASSSSQVSDSALRSEMAALTKQIAELSTNLQSLQNQLLERGLFDPNWQEQPAAPASETPAKAPESAELVETQPKPAEPLKVFEPAGLVDLNAKTAQAAETTAAPRAELEPVAVEAIEPVEPVEPAEPVALEAVEPVETSVEQVALEAVKEQTDTTQSSPADAKTAELEKSPTEIAELVEVEADSTAVATSDQLQPQLKSNQSKEIV